MGEAEFSTCYRTMKGPRELHALSIKSSEPDSDLDYEIELIPFLISIKVMTETGA